MSINIFSPSGSYTSPSITNLLGNGGAVCDGYIFAHKRAITIHGNEAASASDYQMKLNIYNSTGTNVTGVNCSGAAGTVYAGTSSFSSSAFSDLRFGTVGATTGLPYWIESSSASVSAVVWVKLPAIPASASADTTIYMYYGNAGASAGSDPSTTFIVGDDFRRADNATVGGGWTAPAIYSINTLRLKNSGAALGSCYQAYTISGKKMVEASLSIVSNAKNAELKVTTTNKSYRLSTATVSVDNKIYWLDTSGGYWHDTGIVYVANTPIKFSIMLDTVADKGTYYVNGIDKSGAVTGYNESESNTVMVQSIVTAKATEFYTYWFFVRNWTTNEPTWSSFGAEEGNSFTFTSQTSNIIIGDEVSE